MGYESPAEMQGLNMRALHLSKERYKEIGKILYTPMQHGEQAHTEFQLQKKDGTPIWADISGRALDRNIPPDINKGVVVIIDDISQRKRMEEEILHNRKLESFAIMTGGLGHDFNNIITAILGNIDLSLTALDPENQISSFLHSAKEATLRAKDLTHRLQTFSKESRPVLQTALLPELIQKAESVFSHKGISISCHFTKNLKAVEIDVRQIDKAIRSLLKNSAQAMPDGGKIHISCSNFDNDGNIIGLRKASYVQTTITDTGQGIPADIITKIFDPYFTTKTRSDKKGSGLGLATVHSIIQRHKGVITAKSNNESNGATFTFYLPASKATQNNQTYSKHHKGETLGHRKKKVLVMDDDEGIRDIIVQMLTLTGYEVETAIDGETAVSLYRAAMDTFPFQAVIMDLNIPQGMGGVDAVRKIGALDKDAKVIVSSGDAMDPVMLDYKNYGFTAAVSKPFDFSKLHKALSEILNS
jgi:PAS domain S-box-containing protein